MKKHSRKGVLFCGENTEKTQDIGTIENVHFLYIYLTIHRLTLIGFGCILCIVLALYVVEC